MYGRSTVAPQLARTKNSSCAPLHPSRKTFSPSAPFAIPSTHLARFLPLVVPTKERTFESRTKNAHSHSYRQEISQTHASRCHRRCNHCCCRDRRPHTRSRPPTRF